MSNDRQVVTFSQVLRNRQFLALWLAQSVSNFGDWLAMLALFSAIAFRSKGTPYEVSGIMIAFVLPVAFFGPLAGVLVDRWNLKNTMIASDLIRAVLVVMLAFSTELFQIYILLFAISSVSCFFLPAQTVAIPLIVRKEELLVANSLNSQTIQLNRVISPAVAGLMIAWLGERACFFLDGITFIFSAMMISVVALKRETAEAQGISAIPKELAKGLRFIASHKAILFVIISMAAAILAVGAFDALIAVYIRDILLSDEKLFGAIISLTGVGTVAGAIVIGKFGQAISKVYMVALGILAIGLFVLVVAAASSAIITVACTLFFGVAVALVLVPSQTLLQEDTPQAMLGRVSSTSISLMTIAQLVSFLSAGAIAARMGIRNLYYVVGAMLCLTGLIGLVYAKLNRLPEAKAPAVEPETPQI